MSVAVVAPAPSEVTSPLHLAESDMAARPGVVPSLDGLRAISVGIVLLSHFVSANIFPGGLGVYVFFVISGFLITRLLFAEQKRNGSLSLPSFYVRRGLRLYPVVIVYTALVVAGYLATNAAIDWRQPLAALFYFANYLYAPLTDGPNSTMPFVPLWSLSVEEHFYFLLPALVLILKGRPKQLLIAMAVVCAGCLALRLGVAVTHPELVPTRAFYYRTEFRLDALAFGVALAALCELAPGRVLVQKLVGPIALAVSLTAILFSLLYRDPFFRETVRYSVQGLAISVAVACVLFRRGWVPMVLNTPPFVWVGRLSYSLYIWSLAAHPVVAFAMPEMSRPLEVVCLLGTTFLLACASYYGLERPLLGLRARFGSLGR